MIRTELRTGDELTTEANKTHEGVTTSYLLERAGLVIVSKDRIERILKASDSYAKDCGSEFARDLWLIQNQHIRNALNGEPE